MAQIHDGPSNLSHEHQQPPQVSAFNYAAAKLKDRSNGSPVLSVAAIALYLHFKDEAEVDFLTLAPYLRKYPLYDNNKGPSYREDSFYCVWEMVSDLRQNKEMDIDVFRELVDENVAWTKPHTDEAGTTTGFLKPIAEHRKHFVSESVYRNFDAVLEVFNNLKKKDASADSADLCAHVVENMYEDSLKSMRAMYYFGLLAYDARHKTQDEPENTPALKEQFIREAAEAERLAEEKHLRSLAEEKQERKMLYTGGGIFFTVAALIVAANVLPSKTHKTTQKPDKSVAPPQEWYDAKQIILRDTTTQKEQSKDLKYLAWPVKEAQELTPGQ